jgi:hypothetical protein
MELVYHDGVRWFAAGDYDADIGVLVKRLEWRHILRRPPAIAVQASVLSELEHLGAKGVLAIMPNGRRLFAPLSEFRLHGIVICRGYGEQVALPLKYWREAEEEKSRLQLVFQF